MDVKQILLAGAIVSLIGGCGHERMPIPTAGLQLWLKADAGVTLSDSTVGRWADQSVNGNDAIQPDAPRQPLLVKNGLNGKPVIRFDGFDDRLGLTGSKRMSQISLFVVFKIDSGALGYDPIGFGDLDADGRIWGIDLESQWTGFSPDTIKIFVGFAGGAIAVAPGCAAIGLWHNMNVVTDGVIWNTTLRSNGVDAQITHDATNIVFSVPIGNSTGTGIGGIGGADGVRPPIGPRTAAKCDIAEVILYDTVLPDSVRRAVEKYLGAKYQIPANTGVQE